MLDIYASPNSSVFFLASKCPETQSSIFDGLKTENDANIVLTQFKKPSVQISAGENMCGNTFCTGGRVLSFWKILLLTVSVAFAVFASKKASALVHIDQNDVMDLSSLSNVHEEKNLTAYIFEKLESSVDKNDLFKSRNSPDRIVDLKQDPFVMARGKTTWIRVKIPSSERRNNLSLKNINFAKLEIWTLTKDGDSGKFRFEEKSLAQDILELRPIPLSNAFEVIYRIESHYPFEVSFDIGSNEEIISRTFVRDGLIILFVLLLILSPIVMLLVMNNKSSFYYLIYSLSVAFNLICMSGFGSRYFWKTGTEFSSKSVFFGNILIAFSIFPFVNSVLRVRILSKTLYGYSQIIFSLFLICVIVSLIEFNFSVILLSVLGQCLCVYLATAIWMSKGDNSRSVRLYLISWAFVFLGGAIYPLNLMGLTSWFPLGGYELQVSQAFEMAILALSYFAKARENRLEAEQLIRSNISLHRRNRVLVELSFDRHFEIWPNGEILEVFKKNRYSKNRKVFSQLSFEVGKNIFELLKINDAEKSSQFRGTLQHPRPFRELEIQVELGSVESIWLSISGYPSEASGTPAANKWLIAVRDVSELKAAQLSKQRDSRLIAIGRVAAGIVTLPGFSGHTVKRLLTTHSHIRLDCKSQA